MVSCEMRVENQQNFLKYKKSWDDLLGLSASTIFLITPSLWPYFIAQENASILKMIVLHENDSEMRVAEF